MTEFDYDLFKSTVEEDPSVFEGKHLVFCLYNAGRVSEWMQAEYSEKTWSEVLRTAEDRRSRGGLGVSSTDHRFFVRVS